MDDQAKIREMADTLMCLFIDLTSPETAELIRTGPHVQLIKRTLIDVLSPAEFNRRVATMRAEQRRRQAG